MPFPAALPLEGLTEADLADLDVDTLLYVVLDPTATALSRGLALATLSAYIGVDFIPTTEKAAANGVATLDAGGLLLTSQLPPLALGETFTVASQAAMLALVAQRGDLAIRTDLDPDGYFMLTSDSPGTLADWKQILAPGSVVSVDGRTGAVTLGDLYDAAGAAAAAEAAALAAIVASAPQRVDVDVLAASFPNTNWDNSFAVATCMYGGMNQSSGAQNAAIEFEVALPAGTWTLFVVHEKRNNAGIYTVTLEGAALGTIDGYNASNIINQKSNIAGIVVAAAGVYTLKFAMLTKNASSSSYYGGIQGITLRRTGP